jgi:cation diffusion facilitator family transporter
MHAHSLERWQHSHVFLGADHERNERRTRLVVGLTLVMMVGEIVAGTLFGSMALLADGWHMGTHAGALTISALAYRYARRHARSERYAFGTGKVGDLAGFTSAVILACVAVLIGSQSAQRLVSPVSIRFDEAIAVAVLGLIVNLVSALLLGGGQAGHVHAEAHAHDHAEAHAHAHAHAHADHNLRSARLHVLADALTSVFAIAALCAGRFLHWNWMDPLIGVVGALVILRWSASLLRDSGAVLLDIGPSPEITAAIRAQVEADADNKVADLHVWRLGPGHFAAIVSVVTDQPRSPEHYKALLAGVPRLAHVTVEVCPCEGR